MPADLKRPGDARREALALVLLLTAGLLPRLAFVSAFPTVPVSDFHGLLEFALAFRDGAGLRRAGSWDFFNPGLPMVLSAILRISPLPPADTARLATAAACGLLPLLPFAIWRGALPLWVRLLAGGALALWPGQVVFSGVLAQDNWVLLPTVALGSLMVRALVLERSYPVASALLFGLGVAMRQEMLVALAPLALGAGLGPRRVWRWRSAAALAAVSLALLLGLAALRHAATGRFALTSEHGGLALLGAYVPGATADYWADPTPHIASAEPAILYDRAKMREAGFRLALQEALRRPGFHLQRIAAALIKFSIEGEGANFYWSLGSPEVLPASLRASADAFVRRAAAPLRWELGCILALSLASVVAGLWLRSAPILLLVLAIALKAGLHAVVVAQGRYFLAVTALEILAITVAAWEVTRQRKAKTAATALALGVAGALLLAWLGPRLEGSVRTRDLEEQRTYRFPLQEASGAGTLRCRMNHGHLAALSPVAAEIETRAVDPAPGDRAEMVCEIAAPAGAAPLLLQIQDPYETGGLPGRMLLMVTVDGAQALRHDLAAEPGSGWLDVPLGTTGTYRTVRIAVVAVHPDPGAAWGRAARIPIRLARQETRQENE
ncbi:MAG TPA: hypothetical protein VF789_10355 [Thermoanaerobaculia bacterium]